jgi:hypothetical protein
VSTSPRKSIKQVNAETYVRLFEALARRQQTIQSSKRDTRKLGTTLAAAIHFANVSHDDALQKRVVTAARPLIRGSSLFAMRGSEWAVSVEGKMSSLSKCKDNCRANDGPVLRG